MSMKNITSLAQARDYGDRLSKLLKKYRELANFRLTQGDLATRVGVSARSIRDWETGINLPTARNLKKIIEVYYHSGLFTFGKEREEAEELWILRQGKDLSNTFPLFDVGWLESVSSDKTEADVNRQSSEHTTTRGSEKKITTIPTNLMAGNLPLKLTSFIGREKELAEISRLLSHTKLLTITGTGGAGKTRLLHEIATRLQETDLASYPDGVWWVELTPLTDPQQVVQAVISTLMPERPQEGDLYDLLRNFLQPKKLLLVLDNCEHLLEATAGLVQKLLRDCPSLQILTTSRESLNLNGEKVWQLEGLSVANLKKEEEEASAAVQLFVERVKDTQLSFELTSENSRTVLEICRQLDGLPLAIELAAARVKGLGVEQISQRLQKNFKLLSGGSQVANPHHQTVQAMIDWSYNLLSAEEQLLLRRMAVFRGDFSLEAAEGVLGGDAGPGSGSTQIDPDDVLILLLQLVNKSLVVAVSGENNTETRYRLLEMVRQYGQVKLEASGETAYLSYKHLAFYTGFVEKGFPNFWTDQSPKWVERLAQEVPNLHSALTWAFAPSAPGNVPVQQGELALRLSSGLGRFWQLKSYVNDGERWLKESLDLAELADREDLKIVRARALLSLGNFWVSKSDQAVHYLTLSLTLFEELGDKFLTGNALNSLGGAYNLKADFASARAFWFRSLDLAREVGDEMSISYNLGNLGEIAIYQENLDEALDLLQKSESIKRMRNDDYGLATSLLMHSQISRMRQDLPHALKMVEDGLQIFRKIGFKFGIADALNNLSVLQRNMPNYRQARLLAEEAMAIGEELGDIYILSYAYNNLALVNIKEGHLAQARRYGKQSLETRQRVGNKLGIIESLHSFALLAGAQNQWEEYVWLYAAADTLRQHLGISRLYMNEQTELDLLNEQAKLHLDPATLERLRVKGQTDSLDNIVEQLLAT